MKKIGEIANIVPVIAKSDSLTFEERSDFKRRVKEELKFHGINYFPIDPEEVDSQVFSDDQTLDESLRVCAL